MRQHGLIHPQRMGIVVAQNAASVVFTKPRVVSGSGTVTAEAVLAAQSVRVSYDNRAISLQGQAGEAPVLNADVYAATGADIAEGYTFAHEGNKFRVTDVIPVPNGIVAKCEAVG